MRAPWRELRAAFDAHKHDDSRIGMVDLAGDAWTATRLLRALTDAYGDGEFVALKMWQLEVVDRLLEDDETEEVALTTGLEGGAAQHSLRLPEKERREGLAQEVLTTPSD